MLGIGYSKFLFHSTNLSGTLILPDGEKAQWKHIEALHKLQAREGLRCGNRITSRHINFEPQIMKVSLAAQTLSASVADSLKYCRETLHLRQFQDSKGTETLLRLIDHLFDVLNISSPKGTGWKRPISLQNQESVQQFLTFARSILSQITDGQHNLMVRHPRKTPFIGFCINIDSIEGMMSEFLTTRRWQYLLTYKFSQDHLELLFNCIRRTGERRGNVIRVQHILLCSNIIDG